MKFIHLSDLHIGKRVNEFSMLDDQKYIFDEILEIIDKEKPHGVLIAGDIYDKSVPSAEAVVLCDKFLTSIAKLGCEVFVIYGNHDSDARIAFGSGLMEKSGVHISTVYDGEIKPYKIKDENGVCNIYLLPFIKPANVRAVFEDEDVQNYNDAMRVALSKINLNKNERNILVTHQFVTGSERCESEEISVGGTDNIDVSVFQDFDYVALGHIHRPQNCKSERVRYCGTPLKYSFSEAKDKKSVTVVELGEKGDLSLRFEELHPLHDMVEIKGTFAEITDKNFYENTTFTDDYIHITLTDEEDIPDAIGKLRIIYKNLMKLDYDNTRTRTNQKIDADLEVERKSPLTLFSEFYEKRNNKPMTEEQTEYISELIESIWEE